jgi:hypothetical protein
MGNASVVVSVGLCGLATKSLLCDKVSITSTIQRHAAVMSHHYGDLFYRPLNQTEINSKPASPEYIRYTT